MKGKSNPVAKHLRTFNKATVQRDRKKDSKLGKGNKYKKDIYKEESIVDESTKEYAKSLEMIADRAKKKKITPKDLETLSKIAKLMQKESVKMKYGKKSEGSCDQKRKPLGDLRFEYMTKKESPEEFVPHDMFNPETGEKKHAATKLKHLALKAKGWSHSATESVEQVEEGRKLNLTIDKKWSKKEVNREIKDTTQEIKMGQAAHKKRPMNDQQADHHWERKHYLTALLKHKKSMKEDVEFNEAYLDLLEAVPPINMLMPGLVDGSKTYQQAGKEIVKDAWRALTGKQKRVVAKVHKLTQSDDELGKLYRDGWKSGGTSMKPGARKAFDARVKELMPNEESRDYIAAWKSVKAKVQSSMKDQRNESVEQVDEISRGMKNRYIKRASMSAAGNAHSDGIAMAHGNDSVQKKHKDKVLKRLKGIGRATKEEVEMVAELTQREKEMIADRKAKRMTKAGRKDKKTRLLPKTTTYVSGSKEDDHIVMQLRKAQDLNGKFDIRVSPVKGAKTLQLKKAQIDKLLAVHDKLDKPDQKRKYRITLLKTLRSMQQKSK